MFISCSSHLRRFLNIGLCTLSYDWLSLIGLKMTSFHWLSTACVMRDTASNWSMAEQRQTQLWVGHQWLLL